MHREPRCGICQYRRGRGCDIYCAYPSKEGMEVGWLWPPCRHFHAVDVGSSEGIDMQMVNTKTGFVKVSKFDAIARFFRRKR